MEVNETTKGYAEKLITLLAKKTGTDISTYDMDELIQGMLVELEHGTQNPETNVTDDDPEKTFKIVLAHMDELSDYYTRLKKMESEADSVKTDDSEKEDDLYEEKDEKKATVECVSKRFKELCGIVENEEKKQLTNELYQENSKKTLLTEEIDPTKFNIVKFSNDGLGEKRTEDEIDLYKMQRKKKNL